MAPTALLAAAVLVLATFVLWRSRREKYPLPLPPGPRGLGPLGNTLQFPTTNIAGYFDRLAKEYGPLVYLNVGGQDFVVISGPREIKDLFVLKGNIMSSRPAMRVWTRMGKNMRFGGYRYGKALQQHRKIAAELLDPVKKGQSQLLQEVEARQTVVELLKNPAGYPTHFERFSLSILFVLAFGLPVRETKGHVWDMAHSILDDAAAAASFGWLVDIVPFIERLPPFLARYKMTADKWFTKHSTFYRELSLESRKDPYSLKTWSNILRDPASKGLQNDLGASMLMATMYEAGEDTTAIQFHWNLLAALLHQDAQAEVQQELDRVVGLERMPAFSDMDDLHLTRAFVAEAMRWRPAAPFAVPHLSDEGCEYNGYWIPKETVMFSNYYTINRDEERFPDPERFDIKRHVAEDGTFIDRGLIIFGAGRRVCPGQELAERSLFVLTACMLWALRIKPAIDPATGKEIIPDSRKSGGQMVTPAPDHFPLVIEPRTPKHGEVAMREWEQAPKEAWQVLPTL